jgi:hypothetical protein
MKIALTDVLPGGRAGTTIVHLVHPSFTDMTQCYQREDGRVAHRGTEQDVNCMTCLVRANDRPLEEIIAATLRLPKEFLYGESKDDGADDR